MKMTQISFLMSAAPLVGQDGREQCLQTLGGIPAHPQGRPTCQGY